MQTIKVKPWGADQGDHVLINAADFDPAVHQLADGETLPHSAADETESAPAADRPSRRAKAAADNQRAG